jgi:hypothetical protein
MKTRTSTLIATMAVLVAASTLLAAPAQAARSSYASRTSRVFCKAHSTCAVYRILPYQAYASGGQIKFHGGAWLVTAEYGERVPACLISQPANIFAQNGDTRFAASWHCGTIDGLNYGPTNNQIQVDSSPYIHADWLGYILNTGHWIRAQVINTGNRDAYLTFWYSRYCLDAVC